MILIRWEKCAKKTAGVEAVDIAKAVQAKTNSLKEFHENLATDKDTLAQCWDLRARVNDFSKNYPMPGHADH